METKPKRIRIIIVHSQTMFREGLKRLLESETDLNVVADTENADQIGNLVLRTKPDILLIDLHRLRSESGISGIPVLHRLAAVPCSPRIIVMNTDPHGSLIMEYLKAGVRGVLHNHSGISLVLKCIRTVTMGEYWIPREAMTQIVSNLNSLCEQFESRATRMHSGFSAREQQILNAIVSGYSNKDIADELSISEQAVKYHLTHIFRKVGVTGRMELARFTIDHQLVPEI